MQMFYFDSDVAKPVTDYGSSFRLCRLLQSREREVRVDCMYFEAHDSVGHHQGRLPQLFCVVEGEGWVRGEGTEREPIVTGQAVFWAAREGHAAGTESGMAAIVIQSEALDPASWLQSVKG
jgi:quercetin dioxygenase-like cupin family protein